MDRLTANRVGQDREENQMPHQRGDPEPDQVFLQWEPKKKQYVRRPPLTLGASPVSPFLGAKQKTKTRLTSGGFELQNEISQCG